VGGKLTTETAIIALPWRGLGRTLVGCGGTATVTNTAMIGAVDQVAVWGGLLSEAQIAAAANELPAGVVGAWQLRETGADDTGHGYELTVPEPVVPEPSPEPTPEPEPTEEPEPTQEPEPTEPTLPTEPSLPTQSPSGSTGASASSDPTATPIQEATP
jgi:hypothetical protein